MHSPHPALSPSELLTRGWRKVKGKQAGQGGRGEEFRLLQCSAIPWRYKDCKFSWYKARTRDTQIIIPGLILASILHILQFIRTKIGCFQACFLYNRIQERTYSLWAHLWKNWADYKNPLFRADHSQTQGTLHLPTTPCNFMYKYVNL